MTFRIALLVLLFSSVCSGCGDGCLYCAGISKICTGCMDGYWLQNDRCNRCPDNCEQYLNDTHCSKCKANFWGTGICTCEKQCPESCDENGCEKETGLCYGCLFGFYGTNCLLNCTLCKDGTCDLQDGECTNGCIDGYFEDTVNAVKTCRKCSNKCTLCRSQAICLECDTGFYKMSYEVSPDFSVTICYPCPYDCDDCNTASSCTVCKSGKYGPLCQFNCSIPYCHRCNVETCTECITGYELNGTSCLSEKRCSQNCACGCDKNAQCVGGCNDGWSGEMCTMQCASQCQTCTQNNQTECTKCKGDYFMLSCTKHCNKHCQQIFPYETCRLHDGFCVNGCSDGYWGDTCNQSCYDGCTSVRCSQANGYCAACHRNYYGTACENICSESCVDDGSTLQICRKSDGRCEVGCNNGYSGARCDQISSQGMTTFPTSVTQEPGSKCSQQDTNGNKTTSYLLGIVIGAGIALMVAAGIGLFFYLRRRQKFASGRNNELESREQIEYENTAVGMRVMPSVETDHYQPPSEASLNVYEGLKTDRVNDQQQYSELGKPKDKCEY